MTIKDLFGAVLVTIGGLTVFLAGGCGLLLKLSSSPDASFPRIDGSWGILLLFSGLPILIGCYLVGAGRFLFQEEKSHRVIGRLLCLYLILLGGLIVIVASITGWNVIFGELELFSQSVLITEGLAILVGCVIISIGFCLLPKVKKQRVSQTRIVGWFLFVVGFLIVSSIAFSILQGGYFEVILRGGLFFLVLFFLGLFFLWRGVFLLVETEED